VIFKEMIQWNVIVSFACAALNDYHASEFVPVTQKYTWPTAGYLSIREVKTFGIHGETHNSKPPLALSVKYKFKYM
jgi:hypothetical protein